MHMDISGSTRTYMYIGICIRRRVQYIVGWHTLVFLLDSLNCAYGRLESIRLEGAQEYVLCLSLPYKKTRKLKLKRML